MDTDNSLIKNASNLVTKDFNELGKSVHRGFVHLYSTVLHSKTGSSIVFYYFNLIVLYVFHSFII